MARDTKKIGNPRETGAQFFGNTFVAVGGGLGADVLMGALDGNIPFFAKNTFASPAAVFFGSMAVAMIPKQPAALRNAWRGAAVISGVELANAALDLFMAPKPDVELGPVVQGKKNIFNPTIRAGS